MPGRALQSFVPWLKKNAAAAGGSTPSRCWRAFLQLTANPIRDLEDRLQVRRGGKGASGADPLQPNKRTL
jgi:hypothetical protein